MREEFKLKQIRCVLQTNNRKRHIGCYDPFVSLNFVFAFQTMAFAGNLDIVRACHGCLIIPENRSFSPKAHKKH